MESKLMADQPGDSLATGIKGDWMYMGFTGIDGNRTGSAMLLAEESKRDGQVWYIIDNPDIPFYYFSPAHLYYKPLKLNKGQNINLKYRVLHLEGEVTRQNMEKYAAGY
jgi:hypothetical protein